MVGQTVEICDLDGVGIRGDRQWAVRDMEAGGIRGAKKFGELMQLSARPVDGGHVEITTLDGRCIRSDDEDVHTVLSVIVGSRVRLERLPPASDVDHFRRGRPQSDDMMQELRSIFGREEGEPLPDFSVFPPEVVEYESPPGTYHDCWPLMIMSTSALDALQDAVPDAVVDVRRFRPSIVIDTGDAPGHPEFSWSGRTARLGSSLIEFLTPCPRCVMVTRRVGAEIPADRTILRHIVRDLDQNVGVYARVITPGQVQVNDELVLDA